jgi:hypothetical protein
MSVPMLTAMIIVAIGLVGAAFPVMAGVYRRFRDPRTVVCPESGLEAQVRMDAWHAAVTAIPGPPGRYVAECSLRPKHGACGQECLADPALP